ETLGRDFPFVVYLPKDYADSGLAYPVLYLMHGAGGSEQDWDTQGSIKSTADRLIATGAMPPAVIVMPGCIGCWWIDGARSKAETAFWSDLVPAIASRFRTLPAPNGVAIAGISAGGFGAIRYGLTHPDRFAAVAALSPAVYADVPPAESAARSQPAFLNPDGSFNSTAWRAANYPSTITAYRNQRRRLPFYLVSGDNDRLGIAFETFALFKQLYGFQPEQTELRIVDGDHSWAIWTVAIEGAMRYIFRHTAPPASLSKESPQIAAKSATKPRAIP
ncbi:MAG: prolyl oligopeptidase family serine peptidase, partial [Proteobacteria bacterium]|nr:prolyl oligopeptidase family serine peptidase [Pseudomonadota bacterium]